MNVPPGVEIVGDTLLLPLQQELLLNVNEASSKEVIVIDLLEVEGQVDEVVGY